MGVHKPLDVSCPSKELITGFTVLQNERRYLAIILIAEYAIRTHKQLSEYIAAVEHGCPVDAVKSRQKQSLYVALYQTHLPLLAEEEIIEYRRRSGKLNPGPNFDTYHEMICYNEAQYCNSGE